MNADTHIPVLLQEAIDGLDINPGDIFVDGTLGSGGHSELVAKKYGSKVKIIGIDMDADAIARSKARLAPNHADALFIQGNFRNLDTILDEAKIGTVNRILLDIGLSSNQFEESGRGFSFKNNEPLVMTFKKELENEDLTADRIVNTWDEENIVAILKGYGEEQFAEKIAHAIVEARAIQPIATTSELEDIVRSATPGWYQRRKINPATKTFQALRITVNDELGALTEGLTKSFDRLAIGGRMAVISFHSLEDRIIKNFFKDKRASGSVLVNKHVIKPSREEIIGNRRSRSAKLRILEKH